MGKLLQLPIFLCYAAATVSLAVLVLVGFALTKLYRLRGWPQESVVGNCWSYAIPLWLKAPRKTYLVVDVSRFAPVPHVRFAQSIDGLMVREFKPARPQRGFKGVLDSFWFRGRIRVGKGKE